MKIIHISDTHIRNYKYHKEYRQIFDKQLQKIKELQPDYIVHSGDVFHSKTIISPEAYKLCCDFFNRLSEASPIYVILGNHDRCSNQDRLDSLTPVFEAMNNKNIHFLKGSQEVELKNDIILNCLCITDKDNWITIPTDKNKINIALFHGSVSGCVTETGYKMEHGEVDLSLFDNFDYAFLGDIHRTNQILDKKGKKVYAGSQIQQNHAETNDKGFLLWEIESKEKFKCTHFSFKNPKPFITIELNSDELPNDLNVVFGARIRLILNRSLPYASVKNLINVIKIRFKPETFVFIDRPKTNKSSLKELINFQKENLRDIVVQEGLLKGYLKNYKISNKTMKKVFELNRKYDSYLLKEEDIVRNLKWRLKKIWWDNTFNYGEGNTIDFEKIKGIVGIFGPSFSGKSSIVENLLYSMFNSTSKNIRKNLDIINQNQNNCLSGVEIEIDNKTYIITRKSEKYEKKIKDKLTLEARTEVEFHQINGEDVIDLSDVSRNETDKNIRRIFGSLEDFLLTSMGSQFGAMDFINEGSTRRKEILAKFLDLDVFETKYKLAKNDVTELKGLMKKLEEKEFDEEIDSCENLLTRKAILLETNKENSEGIKKEVEFLKEEKDILDKKISTSPIEVIDIDKIKKNYIELKNKISSLETTTSIYQQEVKEDATKLDKINKFIQDTFNIEEYQGKKKDIDEKRKYANEIKLNIKHTEEKYLFLKKKQNLLKEVPCGEQFPMCKFIKDAHDAKKEVKKIEIAIQDFKKDIKKIEKDMKELNPDKIEEFLRRYDKVIDNKEKIQKEIPKKELLVKENQYKILEIKNEIEKLEKIIKEYDENKDIIKNIENFKNQKRQKEKEISIKEENLEECEKSILELYKEIGSYEQKLKDLDEQRGELKKIREEYEAYDLYLKAMSSGGIAYNILKERLPIINAEISKVLSGVVDFEVKFEANDKKLDIYIKHPKYESRTLDGASGAEKILSSMAIRLGLIKVSSLPLSNIFILDEPATALDSGLMDGFINILDIIKENFDSVLLISHLQSLKDVVDMTIDINKNKDGTAKIRI